MLRLRLADCNAGYVKMARILRGVGSSHGQQLRALVHFGLNERGPRRQLSALTERVQRLVPAGAPLVVAGDFNDWRNYAGREVIGGLGLAEVFRDRRGRPARTYPSALPLLRLDRIYARGFSVVRAEVHHGLPWSRISDHAAPSAELDLS